MTKIQNKFMSAAKNLIKFGFALIILAFGVVVIAATGAACLGAI